MIKIRSCVFETNSSAEHTVSLNPLRKNSVEDIVEEIKFTTKVTKNDIMSRMNKETNVYEIPRNMDIEFGRIETFVEKLEYLLFLCVMRHYSELDKVENSWSDVEGFTAESANEVLKANFSELIKKLSEYITNVYGIECKDIKFREKRKRGDRRYCTGEVNHQIMFDTDKENFGLDVDPFTIITTEGMFIDYQFC